MQHLFKGEFGSFGHGDGQFNLPTGIAVGVNGNLYVADRDNHRIQKFSSDGGFLDKWGSLGSGNGEFIRPQGIAVDSNFDIYVADSQNDRVQKFDRNGNFIRKWGSRGSNDGQFSGPNGIAVETDDDVIVVDSGNFRIQKFTSDGEFIRKWGSQGSGNGQFDVATLGIAVDSNDDNYITEQENIRVQKFDRNGNFIRKWESPGSGNGEFHAPHGIATFFEDIFRGNSLMVVDSGNNDIQEFTRDGVFITTWGERGTLPGQFIAPAYVAIIKTIAGQFPPIFSSLHYVTDQINHRIQIFRWELEIHPIEVSSGDDGTQSNFLQSAKQE
jgi:tripartite motif-containing protein 71